MFAVQADGMPITTVEGLAPAPGELSVIQDAFCETHGMQCGFCTSGMILVAHALLERNPDADARRHRRGDLRQHLPLHRLRPDRRGDRACGAQRLARLERARAGVRIMTEPPFKFVSTQPPRARGPALRRRARRLTSADIKRDGMLHVAIVPLAAMPAARIVSIDAAAALAMPGVHHVLDRRGTCGRRRSDAERRSIRRACGAIRSRSGRRAMPASGSPPSSRRRARSPRMRPSSSQVDYEPLPHRDRCRGRRYEPDEPAGASRARLQRAARQDLRLGRGRPAFRRERRATCPSASPGDATPPCRSRPSACWRRGTRGARCSTCGPRSRCRSMPTRSPARCGCRPTPCACTTMSMSAAATASSAASSTPCWSAISRASSARPVRLIEDRLENMRAGDMHGPGAHLRCRGGVRRRGHRQVDEDARARQCRRLRGARAVPARQADRRHRRSLQDRERAVSGALGDDQQGARRRRCAASARRRPTTRSRPRSTRSPQRLGSTGSKCGGAISSATRSFRI